MEVYAEDFEDIDSLLDVGVKADTSYSISGFISNYLAYLLLGFEYQGTSWFPAWFGFASGGQEAFQWGQGDGLNFSHYAMDIGFPISFGQSTLF